VSALHRFSKRHLDLIEDIVGEGVNRGQFEIEINVRATSPRRSRQAFRVDG
jgi:hypothetical protein